MKKMTFPTVLLTLLLIASITSSIRAQELMMEIPLRTQVQSSSHIIEGKVIAKASFWDADQHNIYTVNTVEVFKLFKGQLLNETIEIITPGGSVGNKVEIVTPSLSLNIGEIGVFMLTHSKVEIPNNTSLNSFKTYAASQGFYKYDVTSNTVYNPFMTSKNITDVFYKSITTHTNNIKIVELSTFDIQKTYETIASNRTTLDSENIIEFTPTTVNGGVRDVLTINGENFGNTKGIINFRDANFGGSQYIAALDSQVLTWTTTQITVEVPSRAGTGDFQVVTANGATITSSTDLTVFYSQINPSNPTTAFSSQHFDLNGLGGYTWQMHTEFNTNTAANASFSRAFDSWVCTTGINWEIGAVTTTDIIADDDVNVIRFDNGAELPEGVLGRTTTRFSGCNSPSSPGGLGILIDELDIVFNDVFTGNLSQLSWEFGPDTASGLEIDFESVAVHELGHAHLLAHIIDPGQVMHYSLVNGQNSRDLGPSDLNGANNVMDRNLNEPICESDAMTASDCSTLTTNNLKPLTGIQIYPNPATTKLTIAGNSNTPLDTAIIYDVSGRMVLIKKLKTTSNNVTVGELKPGVYFIKIISNNNSTTKKFIIE